MENVLSEDKHHQCTCFPKKLTPFELSAFSFRNKNKGGSGTQNYEMAIPNSLLFRWYFRHLQTDSGKSMHPINFSGLFLKTQPNKKQPIKSVEEEMCLET